MTNIAKPIEAAKTASRLNFRMRLKATDRDLN
jgi:hypothetical protein